MMWRAVWRAVRRAVWRAVWKENWYLWNVRVPRVSQGFGPDLYGIATSGVHQEQRCSRKTDMMRQHATTGPVPPVVWNDVAPPDWLANELSLEMCVREERSDPTTLACIAQSRATDVCVCFDAGVAMRNQLRFFLPPGVTDLAVLYEGNDDDKDHVYEGEIVNALRARPSITKLTMYASHLTPGLVANMTQLRALVLVGDKGRHVFADDLRAIASFIKFGKNLEFIDIQSCISTNIIWFAVGFSTSLKELRVRYGKGCSYALISDALNKCKTLESLCLSAMPTDDDQMADEDEFSRDVHFSMCEGVVDVLLQQGHERTVQSFTLNTDRQPYTNLITGIAALQGMRVVNLQICLNDNYDDDAPFETRHLLESLASLPRCSITGLGLSELDSQDLQHLPAFLGAPVAHALTSLSLEVACHEQDNAEQLGGPPVAQPDHVRTDMHVVSQALAKLISHGVLQSLVFDCWVTCYSPADTGHAVDTICCSLTKPNAMQHLTLILPRSYHQPFTQITAALRSPNCRLQSAGLPLRASGNHRTHRDETISTALYLNYLCAILDALKNNSYLRRVDLRIFGNLGDTRKDDLGSAFEEFLNKRLYQNPVLEVVWHTLGDRPWLGNHDRRRDISANNLKKNHQVMLNLQRAAGLDKYLCAEILSMASRFLCMGTPPKTHGTPRDKHEYDTNLVASFNK